MEIDGKLCKWMYHIYLPRVLCWGGDWQWQLQINQNGDDGASSDAGEQLQQHRGKVADASSPITNVGQHLRLMNTVNTPMVNIAK